MLFLLNRLEPGFWRGIFGRAMRAPSVWTEPRPVPNAPPRVARRAEGIPGEIATAGAPSHHGTDATATDTATGRETATVASTGEATATVASTGEATAMVASTGEATAMGPTDHVVPASGEVAVPHGPTPGGAASVSSIPTRVARAWQLDTEHRYGEAWAIVRTLPETPSLLRLRALTALYARQDDEALRLAEIWVGRDPSSVDARMALVQAHLQRGEDAAARSAAAVLAARGGLDVEQWRRLAALQRWAGDPRAAAASDLRILDERPDDVAARIDLASALVSAGEPAEALAEIRRARRLEPDSSELTALAARAYTSLGDAEGAAAEYDRALAGSPQDVALELEAARFFVNAGDPARARGLYQRVIERRGPEGLRTELARTLLADGDYAEAEHAAEEAVESREDGPEARLALAQSVYLQGRLAESRDLFDDAESLGLERGLGAPWSAQVALARDYHFAAYRLFGEALGRYDRLEGQGNYEPGPAPRAGSPAALELDRGTAAEKRGDYARAREAYERAAQLGARLGSAVALDRLADDTQPLVEAGYTHFSDANDFQLDGAIAHGDVWVAGDAVRLVAQATAQVVSQHDARYTRTGGRVGAHDFFPRPDLSLSADVGFLNSSAGGGNLVTGDVDLRWFREDTSVVGLLGYRNSLLAGHDDLDPRLFNRIINLAAVTPSFAINGGRLYLDQALRETAHDRLWLSGGVENYEDGNLRGYFYGHYQLPLAQRPGLWAVIRPNAFVEAFKDTGVPNYFSPTSHATVGVAGHTIVEHGRWRVEAEVVPQLIVTNGTAGAGGYGLVDASVDLGKATVGISGFGFYDGRNDYWLAHAMARVVVPF